MTEGMGPYHTECGGGVCECAFVADHKRRWAYTWRIGNRVFAVNIVPGRELSTAYKVTYWVGAVLILCALVGIAVTLAVGA